MHTCPDCGSMIMEGDPYCEHCGAHLSWEGLEEDSGNRNYSNDELDDILESMFITPVQRQALRAKLEGFLKARDCTRMEARSALDEYVFAVTRENEYVRTVDEFCFSPKDKNIERVFCDSSSYYNHDGLLKSPEFQELVRKTGLEFIECRYGHKTEYRTWPPEYRLIDEIDVIVYFRVSDNRERFYHLDLENMALKPDYHEYDV